MVVTVGDMDHRAVLTNPIGAWHTLLVFCAKSVEIVDIMSQIFQRVVDAKCSQEGPMARSSPIKTIAMLLLCLFLPSDTALAKPAADLLAPTRAKLDALKACLGASDALATLRKGLLWGWPKPGNLPTLRDATPAPPPPPEYLESLDRDVRACDFALTVQDEEHVWEILGRINFQEPLNGSTPLLQAVEFNNSLAIIEALINAGANVRHKDFIGNSALHLAANESRPEVVTLLIARGADVKDKNLEGLTPFDLAKDAATKGAFVTGGAGIGGKA